MRARRHYASNLLLLMKIMSNSIASAPTLSLCMGVDDQIETTDNTAKGVKHIANGAKNTKAIEKKDNWQARIWRRAAAAAAKAVCDKG